ncbi:hypothetical protein ABZ807_03940 [Micromonospora sp. NPDC047548]|uniref:hypothetical protein n=1 Tax=Micromonospora sp. NPDC047548 TaxID=3155624 RepID=UPI0033E3DBD5
MTGQYRARFDAEVTFANGGGLRTDGFRLDIPGRKIDDGGASVRRTARCWPPASRWWST